MENAVRPVRKSTCDTPAGSFDFTTLANVTRGGLVARVATQPSDVNAAQALRHTCFVKNAGRAHNPDGLDHDEFDARCNHVLIEDMQGHLHGCFRVQYFAQPSDVVESYSAQYYGLDGFAGLEGGVLELGRFCISPDVTDPDALRLAWGMLAQIVDHCGAKMLFGCSSFAGTDPTPYNAAFQLLAAQYMSNRVSVKSGAVVRFSDLNGAFDRRDALKQVPALLRTYLTMGGWVSDHAVVDVEMNTLHVFTALEIAAIPEARAKALRNVAK